MLVRFTNDLLTGNDQIDNQHKEWFIKLDNFWRAAREGKGKDKVIDSLIFLKDYVQIHFRDEEKLQQESTYPKYESHKAMHEYYIEQVDILLDLLQERGADFSLSVDTLNTMLEWVVTHIQKVDKDLALYLGAKPQTTPANEK